ncbi:4-carboxymuconolactone decarboxylase [Sphaerulina musiva]
MPANYTPEEIQKAHEILYNEGIKMRYQVAGKEYVDKSLAAASNPFAKAMQDYVSESCWGSIWTRPGLPLKIRSFLNIAMLCNQNRSTELATHVKGALNNGASEEEIREVILQAACYCGMPAGIEGFRVAGRAVQEWHEQKLREGEMSRGDQDRHYDVDVASRSKED